jgi:hypothetical protein
MNRLIKALRSVGLTVGLLAVLAGCAACQAQNKPTVPDPAALTVLIRNSMVALNDANITGNYTVFRDLGSAEFQKANTSARLAVIFAPLRARKLNLGPIVLFTPKLAKPAAIDDKEMLRLTGFFPTQPLRVNFDLGYQNVEGAWRLFDISISTTQAKAASGGKGNPPPATQ